jgi:hypothetical protein
MPQGALKKQKKCVIKERKNCPKKPKQKELILKKVILFFLKYLV